MAGDDRNDGFGRQCAVRRCLFTAVVFGRAAKRDVCDSFDTIGAWLLSET